MAKSKRAAIYIRYSTQDQGKSADFQENELKEFAQERGFEVCRVYSDLGVSGSKVTRPGLDGLMTDCKKRKFDVVLVWKFDRFARSLAQLVSAMELFKALNIDFVSCTEAIDTTLPMGQFVFHVFGAIAQFERELIRERTRAGLREARRKGKRLGRPSAAPIEAGQIERILRQRLERKASLRKLAREFGLPLWRIHAVCRKSAAHV